MRTTTTNARPSWLGIYPATPDIYSDTPQGKEVAEVHDYHDVATPILAASLRRRMPGYRALGFDAASHRRG